MLPIAWRLSASGTGLVRFIGSNLDLDRTHFRCLRFPSVGRIPTIRGAGLDVTPLVPSVFRVCPYP